MPSELHALLAIGVIALVTLLLRATPFWLFPPGRPVPAVITYLGRVLPSAMIGLLVIYCLKDLDLTAAPYALPELGCVVLVAALHIWKRNTLLSIGVGTVCYMLLTQLL